MPESKLGLRIPLLSARLASVESVTEEEVPVSVKLSVPALPIPRRLESEVPPNEVPPNTTSLQYPVPPPLIKIGVTAIVSSNADAADARVVPTVNVLPVWAKLIPSVL